MILRLSIAGGFVLAFCLGCGFLSGSDTSSGGGGESLSPGFTPDPHTMTGTSGGSVDASTFSPGCAGNVGSDPNHTLTLGADFGSIYLMAHADMGQDTTLVVQKPDGSYACNDDGEGLDPKLEIQGAAAGDYKVWVGSYTDGEQIPYTLGVSELATTNPSQLAAQ